MPFIQEEKITIKLYKLHKKDSENLPQLTGDDIALNLEAIVQELVGDEIVVEIEKDQ